MIRLEESIISDLSPEAAVEGVLALALPRESDVLPSEGPKMAYLSTYQQTGRVDVVAPFRKYIISHTYFGRLVEEIVELEVSAAGTRVSYVGQSSVTGPILKVILRTYLRRRVDAIRSSLRGSGQ